MKSFLKKVILVMATTFGLMTILTAKTFANTGVATGDSSNLTLPLLLIAIALVLAIIAALLGARMKRSKQEEQTGPDK